MRTITTLITIFTFTVHFVNPLLGQTTGNIDTFSIVDTTKKSDDSLRVTVYITFIIDKEGHVKEVEVLKTECDSCGSKLKENFEKEATRVVNEMPPWEPTKQEKKPKKVRYNLPIKFVIPKDTIKEDE